MNYKFLTVRLDEEEQKRFELVKRDLGAKNDSEVVRQWLNDGYKKILSINMPTGIIQPATDNGSRIMNSGEVK